MEIGQPLPVDEPERWWFTFGGGHTHPDTGENLGLAYVVIEGTYESAREAMFASAFGRRWSHQYSSAAKAGVDEFELNEVAMPKPQPSEDAPGQAAMSSHAECGGFAGKSVVCDRCGTQYVCTPSSDYYCTPEGDHCCEPCLIGNLKLITIPMPGDEPKPVSS